MNYDVYDVCAVDYGTDYDGYDAYYDEDPHPNLEGWEE